MMNNIDKVFEGHELNEVVKNRYDIEVLFDCSYGNPNGDPDADNLPRMDDETGIGFVTDVCIKNKIRQYILSRLKNQVRYNIYIDSSFALNEQHLKAYEALGISTKPVKKVKKDEAADSDGDNEESSNVADHRLTDYMTDNFYDIRTFGAVMTTKVNCGQVRGPVQVSMSTSVDVINPEQISITRRTVTKTEDKKKGSNEMGRKTIIPYGLYVTHIYVSPFDAAKTGFTYGDLKLLIQALNDMFSTDRSAARGDCETQKIYIFEHDSALGCDKSHSLFKRIKISKTTDCPRDFEDYNIIIEKEDLNASIKLFEI